MKRIYVAGPMTGIDGLNFPAFHAAAAELRAQGHEVVNPAEINADPAAGWLECMRADIKQLVDCTAITLLPGWHRSRGATIEAVIALALGMEVMLHGRAQQNRWRTALRASWAVCRRAMTWRAV